MTTTQTTPDLKYPLGPMTGTVEWIGLRAERCADVTAVREARAELDSGLVGDHYKGESSDKRAVTLIQAEHLELVGGLLGRSHPIDPALARRNIVVRGMNLLALKHRRFTIGEATLEVTGPCPPCGRMEENLGEGGYQAMRGHGGVTARVITPGVIRVGDVVHISEAIPNA